MPEFKFNLNFIVLAIIKVISAIPDLDAAEQGRDGGGVKSGSLLYDIGYNDICLSTLLLPDCLHDFLEGVIPRRCVLS